MKKKFEEIKDIYALFIMLCSVYVLYSLVSITPVKCDQRECKMPKCAIWQLPGYAENWNYDDKQAVILMGNKKGKILWSFVPGVNIKKYRYSNDLWEPKYFFIDEMEIDGINVGNPYAITKDSEYYEIFNNKLNFLINKYIFYYVIKEIIILILFYILIRDFKKRDRKTQGKNMKLSVTNI